MTRGQSRALRLAVSLVVTWQMPFGPDIMAWLAIGLLWTVIEDGLLGAPCSWCEQPKSQHAAKCRIRARG